MTDQQLDSSTLAQRTLTDSNGVNTYIPPIQFKLKPIQILQKHTNNNKQTPLH